MRGAFAAKPETAGLDLLLVDDIYTTGATVVECTRVLMSAGARSVRVATLARAGKHFTASWEPFPSVQDRNDPSSSLARVPVAEGSQLIGAPDADYDA